MSPPREALRSHRRRCSVYSLAATVPPQAGSHRRREQERLQVKISPSVPQGKRVISLSLTCCGRGQGL